MKRLSLASKKGNAILDGLLFIVVLFAIGIIGFFANYLMTNINDGFQNSDQVTTEAKAMLTNNADKTSSVMDGIFVSVFALMWLLVLVGTYSIKTSPLFFGLFLIMFGVIIFVGLTLANAADDIANNSFLAAYSATMPKTIFIFENFNTVLVFVIATMALTLWGKNIFDKNPF